MTQDEHNMLADLANKIAQTPAPPKDPDAEEFIRKNIGSRPDALYLMTQTVLIQNMALQQSQHQIQQLQQRLGQPVPAGSQGGGSFLGQSGGYQQPPQQQYGGSAPPPQYATAAPPQYAPSPVAPPPSGMSSFLRNAGQTAAGVAAGTLAVQGIESLFSHHSGFGGGEGMFGGGQGMFGGGGVGGYAPEETVIENNYYGDPQGGGGNQSDLMPNDNSDQLQDTNYDDSNALGDDSNYDSGTDDSGGTDDNFS